MELKKSTVISAIVCVAGILAEIIFQDIMSKSVFGVILSIILAVVILATAYFTVDGIRTFLLLEREKATEREKEYEQRLYGVLNEQLHFQKEIYRGVYSTQNSENLFHEEIPNLVASSDKSSEEIIKSINDNTMVAAKTIAKYIGQNNAELKTMTEAKQAEVIELLQTIEKNQQRLLKLGEDLKKK